MSGIEYCEPKSVLSALQVIGDVVLQQLHSNLVALL